jgi:cysteine synthase A
MAMAVAVDGSLTREGEALTRLKGLSNLIGNTPLLAVDFEYKGSRRTVFAKCEQMNMTGSIKDRMAFHIIRSAYAAGDLHAGDTIVEVSSGNSGISFAAIGGAVGHPVTIFMPDWMSVERAQLLAGYGAQVVTVSKEQGGFGGCMRLSEEFAAMSSSAFLPRQFANPANVEEHCLGTAPEIWGQLQAQGLVPDAFVAAVGTGGTVMGIGRFLRAKTPQVQIRPVEPLESPVLSNPSRVGHHRIEGIAEEFIPPILDLQKLDAPIAISDGDAILAAQALAAQLGLGVGISSGCNFLAAVQAQDELGADAIVVTVFPDDNKKYLSTDLMRTAPVKEGYLTPKIKLHGVRAYPAAHAVPAA